MPGQDAEVDRQQRLGHRDERLARAELVEGRRDRAFDGVLDRHTGRFGFAGANGGQRGGNGLGGDELVIGCGETPVACSVNVPCGPK